MTPEERNDAALELADQMMIDAVIYDNYPQWRAYYCMFCDEQGVTREGLQHAVDCVVGRYDDVRFGSN